MLRGQTHEVQERRLCRPPPLTASPELLRVGRTSLEEKQGPGLSVDRISAGGSQLMLPGEGAVAVISVGTQHVAVARCPRSFGWPRSHVATDLLSRSQAFATQALCSEWP